MGIFRLFCTLSGIKNWFQLSHHFHNLLEWQELCELWNSWILSSRNLNKLRAGFGIFDLFYSWYSVVLLLSAATTYLGTSLINKLQVPNSRLWFFFTEMFAALQCFANYSIMTIVLVFNNFKIEFCIRLSTDAEYYQNTNSHLHKISLKSFHNQNCSL